MARTVVLLFAVAAVTVAGQSATTVLKWGGDAEGGAPFVAAAADDPSRVTGFDVEVAELISAGLGRTAQFVQTGFTTLDAGVARGDFDVALSGIEDSAVRRRRSAVTIPYYEFREILTVREGDRQRYVTLADLRGRRVATLGATTAADLLSRAGQQHGITPVIYEDDVHPYSDLVLGRVDAVLLDQVLAERGVRRNAGLVNQPQHLAVGHYVGVFASGNGTLRDRTDDVLRQAMRDGRLEQIFRRWQLWNDDQPRLYTRVLRGDVPAPVEVVGEQLSRDSAPVEAAAETAVRYVPSLLRAAGITLVLSCVSMALAVALGFLIAAGRVYGPAPLRIVLTGAVEMLRGTPLLLQLFVIYFGLAAVIQLPAFIAAFLGLGINYAAYESEIYRGALEAVPRGQLDAARTLGLSTWQTLSLVRGPQALRLALAPMTNDFVALLKDSSLVSVITVVELTKQTSILAANIGSWVLPGLLCAALYLAMSLPLARLARRLEKRWRIA